MLDAVITFFLFITLVSPFFGKYIALVYSSKQTLSLNGNIHWEGQNWYEYFYSLMVFNVICIIITFIVIYFQEYLPLHDSLQEPLNFPASLNASISFVTGTFWQSHNGVKNLSIFAQIFALTMQNFLSGATGFAVFVAFIRGIVNNKNSNIGNFYDDFLRALIFILLPVSLFAGVIMISEGVPMEFIGLVPYEDLNGNSQELFLGPIAAQVSIKNFIANGGSIFYSASAHPFEAPSRLVVMLSLFLVIILPIAMIFTYGYMVNALELSWCLYLIIVIVIICSLLVLAHGETKYGLPLILGEETLQDNFNYSGKELIYDKFPSLMWVLSITMSSSGSPNACFENFSPLSVLVLFSNLIMSKFVVEGVGSGFFAMLSYLIIAAFLRGLITAKTANFFGKRITINEINYVIAVFLIMPVGVLLFTSLTLLSPYVDEMAVYGGSQAVTDVTYNFASCFANNGSAFTGIKITTDFFNYMSALAMFLGRYPIIYYSLAISGSFASKSRISNDITIQKHSSIELCFFLILTVILVGAIMYTPLMILGPLLEFINL